MTYLEIPIPNRSEHLWRYTPWKKIHPTKVDAIPEIKPATVMVNGKLSKSDSIAEIPHSQEISRAFLLESNNTKHSINIENGTEEYEINVNGESEMESCHLHFNVRSSGNVCLRLSGNSKWFGISITAVLHKNVTFSFALINDLDEQCTLVRCEDWDILRDSSLEYGELSTGANRIKSDIRTYLKGTNSALTQNIAVNCDAGRVDDHHIEIHHLSPHTNSSLCVNSACANKGHAIGTGLLIIEENCDGSDAGQVFKNLLLSENAKAEAIPELEVLSDDVSAAHGAASSSVDSEQIHYLMARGFSPEDAKTEILEGFLISSFAKLSNEKTRQFLMEGLTVKAD
jgi:Fe-S cluster assembly protein SufD